MNYAIILSGGLGSRFWPLSKEEQPKQFLRICSSRPMLQETIERLNGFVSRSNIYIAANKNYAQQTRQCLSPLGLDRRKIFFEPQAKNTFAPIALLSKNISLKDAEAIIMVFPCDHYIKYRRKFLRTLRQAVEAAKQGYIVTLGIKPDVPETGYGYIKIRPPAHYIFGAPIYEVVKFEEKPSFARAKSFIRDNRYYWNSGIFIFKAQVLLEEICRLKPRDYRLLLKINSRNLNRYWPRLTNISMDYAIMEKTKRMALIAQDFGWRDLGSWSSLAFLFRKDKNGNILRGNCLDIGSRDIFSFSDGVLLATVGLTKVIVIAGDREILVCSADKAQEVKKIAKLLKRKRWLKRV
ncbi:MAG: sugar phosphate nucleotidyltransferase [Candidatus Omnitrophica bacterium]|nr:sugar phosphate nucleotidyltransferase [Candidatus Omnitrophota bacterium]